MNHRAKGFTLIELIVVITIVGILAAVAIPRLANLEREARIASLEALRGAVKSASSIAHAAWLTQGEPAFVIMEGQRVNMTNGYPAGGTGGILAALDVDSVDYTFNSGTFTLSGYSGSDCSVDYTEATTSIPPVITLTTSGC